MAVEDLRWLQAQRNHMWSVEERKGQRIIAWWSTMSEKIEVFSATSYLIFIYLFSLFSSCIAEVLEHEHTQYHNLLVFLEVNFCAPLASFLSSLVFLLVRAGPQSPNLQVQDVLTMFFLKKQKLKLNYI